MFFLFYIIFIKIYNCVEFKEYEKIIICLTSDRENIQKTNLIINSIIEQGLKQDLFEIFLLLSLTDYKKVKELPKEILFLLNLGIIKIKFIRGKITEFNRTLISMKIYNNYPIILINNKCLLPHGWLEMLLRDHFKYPNDAIATNIQFFFDKNGEIKEFSEGFKGEKFGTFNHVTEIVFNFAIFNIDLGGILYPKNFFKNELFYNESLFLQISNNSEDFWQSAFIMLEDKILRQSSKIFDYTQYLLNDINNQSLYMNKTLLLKQNKISFIKQFPYFNDTIKKRQNKIIVSITSYPKRFLFLPDLMKFIRKQNFQINKIIFFIYKEDMKFYDLKINGVQIIQTEKNLRPHLKYFYAMQLFRDHAIITLDDDIGYSKDTFDSLFNSYVQNPNIISGRRSHLMTFKQNGELKGYFKWRWNQKIIKKASFDITLTNVGGSIFPPDILNMNENFLNIINETITCDDLTLKYFANIKGIPMKWIVNKHVLGIPRKLPKTNDTPLFNVNLINNDICINKLNMMINKTLLSNLCVPYLNFPTGNNIYLFDIHNKMMLNKIFYFEIYAFSYCPINIRIKFKIYFEQKEAFCFFNKSENLIFDYNIFKNLGIASCFMNDIVNDLDFYFPIAKSKKGIFLKISNYRKYLTTIFMNFFCQKQNNCILITILLEKIYFYNFSIEINNKQYLCHVDKNYILVTKTFPCIKKFVCEGKVYFENNTKIFISGIPKTFNISRVIIDNNKLPNQFIISRISIEKNKKKSTIIIIGKLVDDLEEKSYKFLLNVLFPETVLKCKLKPNSKHVLSRIYCINKLKINSEIFIENQIVYSLTNKEELLLINEETFIKIKFNQTYLHYFERKKKHLNNSGFNNYGNHSINSNILLIILLLLKIINPSYLKKLFFIN